jgi:hypothetical protein
MYDKLLETAALITAGGIALLAIENNMPHVRHTPLPISHRSAIGPVADDHRIGSLFTINNEQIISEIDSGLPDDISLPPELGERLGLVENIDWYPNGTPKAGKILRPDLVAGRWPNGHVRFWVNFQIPALARSITTLATISKRNPYPRVPLTLITSYGYSVTISPTNYISYELADDRERGIPYLEPSHDPTEWKNSLEPRNPPILEFSVNGIRYPALLDTGAPAPVFSSQYADILGIRRFPKAGVISDSNGPKQLYLVPISIQSGSNIITLPPSSEESYIYPAIISDDYPDGNLIPAQLFLENGYTLRFNPHSLEIGRV